MAAAVPAQIDAQITGFATHVLDPRFHDYAAFGVVGGLATMVVVHLVNAGSLPLTAIAVVGLATGGARHMDRRGTPIIVVAFGVTVVSLVALLMARGIIQTRYAMPAGLLIVVCAAFVIDHWYARARVAGSWLRWATPLLAVYLLGEAAFGLFNSKHHYVDAAHWLAQHSARDARVFSNDVRVVYLAGRKVDWRDANVLSPDAVAPAGTAYDFWVMNAGRERDCNRRAGKCTRHGSRRAVHEQKGADDVDLLGVVANDRSRPRSLMVSPRVHGNRCDHRGGNQEGQRRCNLIQAWPQ